MKLQYVSDSILYFFGYTPEEVVGSNIAKYITKDSLHLQIKLKETIPIFEPTKYFDISLEEDTTYELEFIHRSCKIYSGNVNSLFYTNKKGEIVGIMGILRNVVSKKTMEHMLIENERKYRRLFEDMPEGALLIDKMGRIIEVNNKCLTILGSPSAEITKQINVLTFT